MSSQPRIGAVFSQTEMGADPGAVRAWVQAATELGYSHITVYEHVVGADPSVHEGWTGAYTVESTFHEIFVLFGFIAALTPLELVSSVVILPQRQTVLVAKQAAEVDLTQGRLRLGVGIGWNPPAPTWTTKSSCPRCRRRGRPRSGDIGDGRQGVPPRGWSRRRRRPRPSVDRGTSHPPLNHLHRGWPHHSGRTDSVAGRDCRCSRAEAAWLTELLRDPAHTNLASMSTGIGERIAVGCRRRRHFERRLRSAQITNQRRCWDR